MSEEMNLCPFCGSNKARKRTNTWWMHKVVCGSCGASTGWWYSEEQAVEIWNMRIERTCHGIPYHGELKCSVCGNIWEYKYDYCPDCGSKVVELDD